MSKIFDIFAKYLYRQIRRRVFTINKPVEQKDGYHSQFGQDKFVAEYLNFKHDGFFVDIGAYDGFTLNNTYFFEKELGWKGIAIEPLPEAFLKLQESRICALINGCISDKNGQVIFWGLEGSAAMLSGIVDMYDKQHIERINKEQAEYGGTKRMLTVQSFTLQSILNDHGVKKIDFLSIDTEGSELVILKDIDFNSTDIQMITVENNFSHDYFWKLLSKHGFHLVAVLGCDEVYAKGGRRHWGYRMRRKTSDYV